MVPQTLAPNPGQRACREPFYDINPRTGVSFEVFYADRTLESFGRRGAGWYWWPRTRGCPPSGSPTGPFATSYAAYRRALNTDGADHLSVNARAS
jgi:hypothetical protein